MKKTLLTLVAGASIGAGTVVTLPDGSVATAELPTAEMIYDAESVGVIKLVQSDEGHSARWVVVKTSSIAGVEPLNVVGKAAEVDAIWGEISDGAKTACEATEKCEWSSMQSARNVGDDTVAVITDSLEVSVAGSLPLLEAFKIKLLEEN